MDVAAQAGLGGGGMRARRIVGDAMMMAKSRGPGSFSAPRLGFCTPPALLTNLKVHTSTFLHPRATPSPAPPSHKQGLISTAMCAGGRRQPGAGRPGAAAAGHACFASHSLGLSRLVQRE